MDLNSQIPFGCKRAYLRSVSLEHPSVAKGFKPSHTLPDFSCPVVLYLSESKANNLSEIDIIWSFSSPNSLRVCKESTVQIQPRDAKRYHPPLKEMLWHPLSASSSEGELYPACIFKMKTET